MKKQILILGLSILCGQTAFALFGKSRNHPVANEPVKISGAPAQTLWTLFRDAGVAKTPKDEAGVERLTVYGLEFAKDFTSFSIAHKTSEYGSFPKNPSDKSEVAQAKAIFHYLKSIAVVGVTTEKSRKGPYRVGTIVCQSTTTDYACLIEPGMSDDRIARVNQNQISLIGHFHYSYSSQFNCREVVILKRIDNQGVFCLQVDTHVAARALDYIKEKLSGYEHPSLPVLMRGKLSDGLFVASEIASLGEFTDVKDRTALKPKAQDIKFDEELAGDLLALMTAEKLPAPIAKAPGGGFSRTYAMTNIHCAGYAPKYDEEKGGYSDEPLHYSCSYTLANHKDGENHRSAVNQQRFLNQIQNLPGVEWENASSMNTRGSSLEVKRISCKIEWNADQNESQGKVQCAIDRSQDR